MMYDVSNLFTKAVACMRGETCLPKAELQTCNSIAELEKIPSLQSKVLAFGSKNIKDHWHAKVVYLSVNLSLWLDVDAIPNWNLISWFILSKVSAETQGSKNNNNSSVLRSTT